MERSLLEQTRALERQVGEVLAAYDIAELPQHERELTTVLRNQLIDARLAVQAYDYAQTRAEQLTAASEANDFLQSAQEAIITASKYNLVGAVDVAQLSARIQYITTQLT